MTATGEVAIPCPGGCGEMFVMLARYDIGAYLSGEAAEVTGDMDWDGIGLLIDAHAPLCTGMPPVEP